ncbi:(2Fe-2S)-binding protein [Amycolatopsis aidingensis]|uniref:(2Fe-2S)-binding protein n=1 Tax=Amycolatopsis aidingensis TaxID=2842453 RepID=UPI001C0D25EB|nr:(2Fe-2S)-binding protein [Amycolatopsis aidingensis]
MDDLIILEVTVNGQRRSARVDRRELLVEALRARFGVTGPKIGCLTGDCGACTVRLNGLITKSCLRLAVAEEGAEIETLESMSTESGLSDLQEAFWDNNAFQCGYCLSGMLFSAEDLLEHNPTPNEQEIRQAISGNLCRCTGYDAIVTAIKQHADRVGDKTFSTRPADVGEISSQA